MHLKQEALALFLIARLSYCNSLRLHFTPSDSLNPPPDALLCPGNHAHRVWQESQSRQEFSGTDHSRKFGAFQRRDLDFVCATAVQL